MIQYPKKTQGHRMEEAELYASEHGIDAEKLTRLLPKGTSHKVTDEIILLIKNMESDTEIMQEYMEESVLEHLPVLREVKVTLRQYVNAIKFCTLKKNMTNMQAWEIVFPQKHKKLVDEKRKISTHVSMYNQSPLVVKIDTSMSLNIQIQYAPLLHKSIMKQASIMDDPDASFMVQHLASKTLIETLKPAEVQKHEIAIGQSDESKLASEKTYNEMAKIANNQQKLLEAGHSLRDIQKLNIVHVEVEEDEEEYIDVEDGV